MKKNNLFKTALIEKRNILNEIRKNSMSLQELRFFSIYLSKINSRDISTRVVKFPLADFQKIMDFQSLNFTQLRATFTGLLQQVVSVPNENGVGFSSFQLFKRCKLAQNEYNEWYVEIDAHDDALPLMFEFKNKYFTYELWNALILKSSNQIRMYEILKQYEFIGKREIDVAELRELLGIASNEYSRWERFRTRVLDSCQQALEENTDICFTYEKGKSGQGGKWLTIIFHIKKNDKHIDRLTLEKFIDQQPEPEFEEDVIADERLELLSSACNNEFSQEQMILIFNMICARNIPSNPMGIEIARFHYLSEKYAILNEKASRENVHDRFLYFKGIIQKEIDSGRI